MISRSLFTVHSILLLASLASAVPAPEKVNPAPNPAADAKPADAKPADAKPAAEEKIPNRKSPPAIPPPPDAPPAFEEAAKHAQRFRFDKGLKVDVFAAEPQLLNPVAFTTDEKGRWWVVETFRFDGRAEHRDTMDIRHMMQHLDDDLASRTVEQRLEYLKKWFNNDLSAMSKNPDKLRLIEDRDGDGKADFWTYFADGFDGPLEGLAAGVLVRGNDVYFANIPHLWRLRDTDGDNRADEKTSLSYGYGVRYAFLGHDLHGLRFGPDGRLYFSIGDRGLHVKTPDGRVLDNTDHGAVLRCDPDGSNLEIFATGLRNPQELAFDNYGNLFTGDNNCDYGDPARWVNVVEGGDTGWRIGYQHLPNAGPWKDEKLCYTLADGNTALASLPPLLTFPGGPSGLTYYPGTSLPDKYNETFFLCDFRAGPASAIWAIRNTPKGATFDAKRETMISGVVATDCEFGINGGLYLTDWIAGFPQPEKGRIYRLFEPSLAESSLVKETKKLISEGMTGRDDKQLVTLLSHADQRVRQAAQFELANRGEKSIATLSEVASNKASALLPRIHAMWALGQTGRKAPAALEPLVALLGDSDAEIRAQAAKLAGDAKIAKAGDTFIKLLKDESPRVRFWAAMGIGKLPKRSDALGPIMAMLTKANDEDPYLRHAGTMALLGINDVETMLTMAEYASKPARVAILLALRRLDRIEVARFLDDTDPAVVLEAARAINDVPIDEAQGQLAKYIERGTVMPDPLAKRVLNANFRIGGKSNAYAVANYAGRDDVAPESRVNALTMLADWSKPSGRERVIGVWRPIPGERNGAYAAAAARDVLPGVLRKSPDTVRIAALLVAEKYGVANDPGALITVVSDGGAPSEVRAAALKAMSASGDPYLNTAVTFAVATGTGALRGEAIRLLANMPGAVASLDRILTTGAVSDQQAVLQALAKVDGKSVDEILGRWMDKLLGGTVAPELHLDLLEAAAASKSDAVKAKVKQFDEKRPKDDPLAPFVETLAGGNAKAGRDIFMKRADVSCLRCHKVNGEGGVMGPDMTDLGLKRDRKYILESIVAPNKQISPGFESAVVKLKNGKAFNGVVKSETDVELVMEIADTGTMKLAKSEITARTPAPSPMPDNIAQPLSKGDLRNLVEFLASLKPDTAAAAAPAK